MLLASGLRRQCTRSWLKANPRGFATLKSRSSLFSPLDTFSPRHIGPDDQETSFMLSKLGYDSMEKFIGDTVPPKIRVPADSVDSIPALSESELHAKAKALAGQNKSFKSYIGMGYHCAVVPPVILRNVCQFFHCSDIPDCLAIGDGKPRMVYAVYSISA